MMKKKQGFRSGRQEKNWRFLQELCSKPMLMLSPPGASGVPVVLEKSQTNKWEQVEQVQQV